MWNRLNEWSLLSCALVHPLKPIHGNSHISSEYFVVSLICLDYMFLTQTENMFIGQSEIRLLIKKKRSGKNFPSPFHRGKNLLLITSRWTLPDCRRSPPAAGRATYLQNNYWLLHLYWLQPVEATSDPPVSMESSKVTLAVVRLSVWGKPKVSRVFKQRTQTEHLDYANVPHRRVRNVDGWF